MKLNDRASIWVKTPMTRAIRFVSAFAVAFAVGALSWGTFVADHVYRCTDSAPAVFDFVRPGDWVHAWKPIEFVADVTTRRSMSQADVIKTDWSLSRLWLLWIAMAGGCLAIGFFAAWGEGQLRKTGRGA